MRGCLTTIVFLLITSGLSTFMFGSAFFIAVLLDPDAPSIFELQWHTNVILLVYLIVFLKSASNLNGNLNCSKELEHYAS